MHHQQMPSSARTAGQGHASKALWSILNGLTGVDYAKEVYVSSLHEEYPNPSIQIATDAGPLILGLPLDESGAALLQLRHMKLRHPLVVPLKRAFLDLNNNKGSLYVDEYLCNVQRATSNSISRDQERDAEMQWHEMCHPDCHTSKRVEEIRHCCLVGHGDWDPCPR